MKIESVTDNGELNIKLSGELDERMSAYVRMSLDGLIDAPGIRRVCIDMSGVTFMDSTGVGVLIGRYKRLKPRGVPMIIKSPTKAVDKVLDLSGIYTIMTKAV